VVREVILCRTAISGKSQIETRETLDIPARAERIFKVGPDTERKLDTACWPEIRPSASAASRKEGI